MKNNQLPFILFTVAVVIGLVVPVLIQDGMFMDAVLYTSVAHNLSQGIGTFWNPIMSKYDIYEIYSFHEQPPLGFGIQSIFFRLFGSSMYVERFYTFCMLCITIMLMHRLWKKIYTGSEHKQLSWLPVLIWITIPQVYWSFSNNMLENTMGVFILAGALLIYTAISQQPINYFKLIMGGLFIFLASFTKGIPGLFILAMPGLYWLITGRISMLRSIFATLILILVVSSVYALLLIDQTSRESLRIYFYDRTIHRIGESPTVTSRFFILGSLGQQLAGQLIFCIVIYLFGRYRKLPKALPDEIKTAFFFIATGLCGSLPLMLTLVQKAFYYLPSLAFLAIGLGMICVPVVRQLTDQFNSLRKRTRLTTIFSSICLLFVIGYSISKIGETSRNKEILHDVHAIGKIVPDHTCISLEYSLHNDWQLQTYMMRNYNICLDPFATLSYHLSPLNEFREDSSDYKLVFHGMKYDLYADEKKLDHLK